MQIREVIRRLERGQSNRGIAHDLGLDRKTVAGYRQWAASNGLLGGELPTDGRLQELLREQRSHQRPEQEASRVEPHRARVSELFKSGVEAKAIWQILVEQHEFRGSYSSVRRFVRRLRLAKPTEVFIRIEVPPGAEAQVDFGYAGMVFDPAAGRPRRAWVFVMTLSHSRHQYAEVVFDQSIASWTRLHANAFEFFGGVPERLVIDNLKAGIVRASQDDPLVQRSYLDMCTHYDVLVSPCRPRTPQHKGKVEQGGVHYVKRNALAGREFRDLEAVNAHLANWCVEVAGRRDHGTTRLRPLEVFESIEQGALRPLPATRWEFCEFKQPTARTDGHVTFDGSYYSVPYRSVNDALLVRATAKKVEVYADHELVATHLRASGRGQWRTHRDHLPPDKAAYLEQTPEWCREQAAEVGPKTAEFIGELLGERAHDRRRGARSVLRQVERYGAARLEAACARALLYGEIQVRVVKSILRKGLDLSESRPPSEPDNEGDSESKAPQHARAWSYFFPDEGVSSWS